MNPELIHDALTLLPPDLVQQTDLLRSKSGKRTVRWLPIVSAAACLVLVTGSLLLLQSGVRKSAPTEAAAEAPAMMQAAPMVPETCFDEAPAMEEAAEAPAAEAPDTDASRNNSNTTAAGTKFAAPVTLHTAGTSCTLDSEDSAALNEMLTSLDYNTLPETDMPTGITAESDVIGHITLNLAGGYARKDGMQAFLSEEQIEMIREMLIRASR